MSFQYAVVTGSDSGIGRATAVALAGRGFDVGITWHTDEEGAKGTAREVESHGRRAVVKRLDTSAFDDVGPTIRGFAEELGGLHVLVNNSGTGPETPVLELSLEDWQHTLDVDLTGAFLAAQTAARIMIDGGRGGRIVNVTSVHEHVPLPGAAPYVAAKHGMGGLTKSLALELAEHGILVNSVAPGEIATPMTDQEDEDPRGTDRPGIPLKRPGDAREIAFAIASLCAEESSYTTGASFVVDGGLLLMAAVANQIAL